MHRFSHGLVLTLPCALIVPMNGMVTLKALP